MTSQRALDWDALVVPTDLSEVVDEISYQRVIMNAATTWDYFPGHYDPEYARNDGHPTIFVNTMHIAGFIDRVATDWAGPYSRVVRRKLRITGSIYAGDSMVGRGRLVDKRRDTATGTTRYLVDIEVSVSNQRGELCCPAEVTLDVTR
jgi:acyl dehydratase